MSQFDIEHCEYIRHVFAKIREIVIAGEREINLDSDPEPDINNLYDLVREGVEARKKVAEAAKLIRGKE